MKNYIVIFMWLALVLHGKNVLADGSVGHGLILTCAISGNGIPPAPNGPISFDLKVTNISKTVFNGQYSANINYGAVGSVSPITKSLIYKCSERTVIEAVSVSFKIDPGKMKVFHIVLNDLFPDIKTGNLSGWVVLPLFDEATHPDVRFTLVTPFSVKVN